MRILHVLDHSLPLHSGYSFRTIALLRECNALGYETVHLTGPKQGGAADVHEETVDGWRFFRTPAVTGLLADLPALAEIELMGELTARIEALVCRFQPHVVHAHSPVLNAIPALRVARRHGIPVAYEVRALWEDAAVDHGTTREGSLRYRVTRRLETYAARRVDHVFTICEGLKSELVAREVGADRISVVPNGVDIERFTTAGSPDTELKRSLGLNGATVLGFVGSFYGYEGLQLLVSAMPNILAARPDIRLLLVGGGYQEEALRRQCRDLGLADKVIFVGRVPHSQVDQYYDLIDILVYPRLSMRLTELVTPMKPLEAMAQGRLVIASDVGGHREMMIDGETAVLFRAGDADALSGKVVELLRAPDTWARLKAAARQYVERERTWRKSIVAYERVYERLMQPWALSA